LVLAVALSLSFLCLPLKALAGGPRFNVADPKDGVYWDGSYGITPIDMRRFLFEAARSGSFGVVESRLPVTATGFNVQAYLRYDSVNSVERCSDADRRTYSQKTKWVPAAQPSPHYFLWPAEFEDYLVKGECVIATEIPERTARYVFKNGGLYDTRENNFVIPSKAIDREDELWAAFGLKRPNLMRRSEVGMVLRRSLRLDDVSDAELQSALEGEGRTRRRAAALLVLRDRVAFYDNRVTERQPTGAAVGVTLEKTGWFESPRKFERKWVLEAAAAVPTAASVLYPALRASIEMPIVDWDPSYRYDWDRWTEGLDIAVPALSDPDSLPLSYWDRDLFLSAAFAAARFGQPYATDFVRRYRAPLLIFFRLGLEADALALVSAVSADGADLVAVLLRDSESRAYPIPVRKNMVANAATIIDDMTPIPPAVLDLLQRRCAALDPSEPHSTPIGPAFCDRQFARMGDRNAYHRMVALLEGQQSIPGRNAQEAAARALFFDSGPEGLADLKASYLRQPAGAGFSAGWMLCMLGQDAGPEIVAKAAQNAAALEGNRFAEVIAMNCAMPARAYWVHPALRMP
jgi:hypothetical protein